MPKCIILIPTKAKRINLNKSIKHIKFFLQILIRKTMMQQGTQPHQPLPILIHPNHIRAIITKTILSRKLVGGPIKVHTEAISLNKTGITLTIDKKLWKIWLIQVGLIVTLAECLKNNLMKCWKIGLTMQVVSDRCTTTMIKFYENVHKSLANR